MCISVAESRSTRACRRDKRRGTPSHAKGDAKQDNRSQNPVLHKKLMDSAESQGSTKHHRSHERAGKEPERSPSDLNRPETERHHHKEMVKTGQGMKKTGLGCPG
jgi:hypothetical protein